MIHLLRLAFHNTEAVLPYNPDSMMGKKHHSQENETCNPFISSWIQEIKKEEEEEKSGNKKWMKW